jgi:hypothetical protein
VRARWGMVRAPMAVKLPTLDAVDDANPTLGLYLEYAAKFIVAYEGPCGIFAVYIRASINELDDLVPPAPYICTMRDVPAMVFMENDGSWPKDVADAVAHALADGVIGATPDKMGNLVVSDEDADRALEAQQGPPMSELLETLERCLARHVRLRELNAPEHLLVNEELMVRSRWRAVAFRRAAAEHVWPDALQGVVQELGITPEAYSENAKPIDKLRQIVEALKDLHLLRAGDFNPCNAENTLAYAQVLWETVKDTSEAKYYPWPGSVVNLARDLGIVVRVVAPG